MEAARSEQVCAGRRGTETETRHTAAARVDTAVRSRCVTAVWGRTGAEEHITDGHKIGHIDQAIEYKPTG